MILKGQYHAVLHDLGNFRVFLILITKSSSIMICTSALESTKPCSAAGIMINSYAIQDPQLADESGTYLQTESIRDGMRYRCGT
jgi:hypothetical protein